MVKSAAIITCHPIFTGKKIGISFPRLPLSVVEFLLPKTFSKPITSSLDTLQAFRNVSNPEDKDPNYNI